MNGRGTFDHLEPCRQIIAEEHGTRVEHANNAGPENRALQEDAGGHARPILLSPLKQSEDDEESPAADDLIYKNVFVMP